MFYYSITSKDPKPHPNPKWWMVDWQLVRKLKKPTALEQLKEHKDGPLANMVLFNKPSMSVQPVNKEQWRFILSLGDADV